MTYTFCSLAVGEDVYYNNIFNTFTEISKITSRSNFLISTDNKKKEGDKITTVGIEQYPVNLKDRELFNYNLKFHPIKESIKFKSDLIIFIDADWKVYKNFNEYKFDDLLEQMNIRDIDFAFERPHQIGGSKRDLQNCFWKHKIEVYQLDKTTKYDEAHVCNEQILIFRNNEKLKLFIENWEKLYWRSYEENIWAFAEGVEIGMSTIESGMRFDWHIIKTLNECFHFESKCGIHYTRF